MAVLGPFTNAKIIVNGVDLSDHCTACAVETSRDEVDITAMGATYKVSAPGLGAGTMTATFLQDYAAGSVDATLSAIDAAPQNTIVVEMRPVNAARSTTNPAYVMTARMFGYPAIGGSIGDALTVDVTFQNASQTGIQRLTA
jgi:hypothetical protein